MKIKTNKRKIIKIILLVVPLLIITAALIYLNTWHECTDENAMQDTKFTHITDFPDRTILDGPGNDVCFLFYPGARCDYAAYNSMLKQVSDSGIDIIIAKPPFHMQLFAVSQAIDIMKDYRYSRWVLGGHSMGGTSACFCCIDNPEIFDSIILLSSYSTKDLHEAVNHARTIKPEFDTVLSTDTYNSCLNNLPDNNKNINISGGNHAGFGNYGKQLADGEATISPQEQQNITAKEIIKFIKEL